jgi:hypothetical protein
VKVLASENMKSIYIKERNLVASSPSVIWVRKIRASTLTQLPWNPVVADKCGVPQRNLLAYHCYTNTKCLCYTHVHGGSNIHILKRNQPASQSVQRMRDLLHQITASGSLQEIRPP